MPMPYISSTGWQNLPSCLPSIPYLFSLRSAYLELFSTSAGVPSFSIFIKSASSASNLSFVLKQPALPSRKGRIHASASFVILLFFKVSFISRQHFIILCLLLVVIRFVPSLFPYFLFLFCETPSVLQHLDYVRMFPQIISIFMALIISTYFMIYDTNLSKMTVDLDRHVLIRRKTYRFETFVACHPMRYMSVSLCEGQKMDMDMVAHLFHLLSLPHYHDRDLFPPISLHHASSTSSTSSSRSPT